MKLADETTELTTNELGLAADKVHARADTIESWASLAHRRTTSFASGNK